MTKTILAAAMAVLTNAEKERPTKQTGKIIDILTEFNNS